MKKIADEIFEQYQEEDTIFITEDGQPFFDKDVAKNWADRNEFEEPEVFYRPGTEPEDSKELAEQLGAALEIVEENSQILDSIENALDFTQDPPQVDQQTNPIIAAIVVMRERAAETDSFIQKIKTALFTDDEITDQDDDPVLKGILGIKVSLNSALQEKKELEETLEKKQQVIDGLIANSIEVKDEQVVKTEAKAAPKNSK